MMNLTTLSWTHDGLNTDGTPFTEDQFAGFTLYIFDGHSAEGVGVSVPASWNSDGVYSIPLAGLIDEPGDYSVEMVVAARNGMTSDPSDPIEFSLYELKKPSRPFGLSVS